VHQTTTSSVVTVSANRSAWVAATWAFVFATISAYWALGGKLGVETLGDAFSDPDVINNPTFIVFVWLTVIFKLLLAVLALSVVQRWGNRMSLHLRSMAVGIAGILLTLYGIALMIQHSLMAAGVIQVSVSIGTLESVRWHLFLWDPFWLVGGLLFLNALYRVRTLQRR
jgi:hypothetical protein